MKIPDFNDEYLSCETCLFFRSGERFSNFTGECRRFPPSIDLGKTTTWPLVMFEDYCGEWQKSEITECIDL